MFFFLLDTYSKSWYWYELIFFHMFCLQWTFFFCFELKILPFFSEAQIQVLASTPTPRSFFSWESVIDSMAPQKVIGWEDTMVGWFRNPKQPLTSDLKNPVNNGMNYQPTSTGFFPGFRTNHQQVCTSEHSEWKNHGNYGPETAC